MLEEVIKSESCGVFNNLSPIEYKIVEVKKDFYHFIFRDKKTKELGIPIPNYDIPENPIENNKLESYGNYYLETILINLLENSSVSSKFIFNNNSSILIHCNTKELKEIKEKLLNKSCLSNDFKI